MFERGRERYLWIHFVTVLRLNLPIEVRTRNQLVYFSLPIFAHEGNVTRTASGFELESIGFVLPLCYSNDRWPVQ